MKNVKWICINAMGIALFAVLSLCLQVPVFDNYYLCLGYLVMAVYCWFFGPVSGTIVGTLGVVLYCFLINGLRGLPGWAVGNVVIGISLGLCCRWTAGWHSRVARMAVLAAAVVLSTAAAIPGVKSLVECGLYAQPFLIRVAKNMTAFVADIVVLLAACPICEAIAPMVRRRFGNLYDLTAQ